jgi:hypothetical protein
MKAKVTEFIRLINQGVDMKEAARQSKITDMSVGDFLNILSTYKE